jgi:hypothetical protein
MSGMDGFPPQSPYGEAHGLHRTIAHLHQLIETAEEHGDRARADELKRVVKSYEAQLLSAGRSGLPLSPPCSA